MSLSQHLRRREGWVGFAQVHALRVSKWYRDRFNPVVLNAGPATWPLKNALFLGHPNLSGTGSCWKFVEELTGVPAGFFDLSGVAKFGHVIDKHLSW